MKDKHSYLTFGHGCIKGRNLQLSIILSYQSCIILCWITVATATSQLNLPGASLGTNDEFVLMPYSFNYHVADDDYQTYIVREEESDGETVVGSYSYVDPI